MNATLQILLSSEMILGMVGTGVALIALAVLASIYWYQRTKLHTEELLALALGGQRREARIRAREVIGNKDPMQAALIGRAPERLERTRLRDVAVTVICLLPALGLPILGGGMLAQVGQNQVVPTTAALALAFAALVPLSVIGAIWCWHLGAAAAALVNTSILRLLAGAQDADAEGDV